MIWLTCFQPNTGYRDACLPLTRTIQDAGAPHLSFILWLILGSHAAFPRKRSCFLSVSLLPAQSLQSCLTLCDPLDCRPLGSSVHGILRSRILEWVAMPSSWGSSSSRDQTCLLCLLHCMWIFLPTGPPGKPFFLLKDNKNFPLLDTIVVAVVQLLSCVPLFPNSMDCSRQAPLSWFSRQEYWSGLPFPSPGDLPNPGIQPTAHALAGRFFTDEPTGEHLDTILSLQLTKNNFITYQLNTLDPQFSLLRKGSCQASVT